MQVRGTPGSGKTTLMELLHDRILHHDRAATVEVIKGWAKEDGTTIQDRIHKRIKSYSAGSGKLFLLFDNAQTTYWDAPLWENFFKDVVQHGSGPLAILFCSYGSPSDRPVEYDEGTPLILPPGSRISLTPHDGPDHSGFPPIGLLFSREEFEEAVDRFRGADGTRIHVEQELRQILFDWTMGHAGAVGDLLVELSRMVSPLVSSILNVPQLSNARNAKNYETEGPSPLTTYSRSNKLAHYLLAFPTSREGCPLSLTCNSPGSQPFSESSSQRVLLQQVGTVMKIFAITTAGCNLDSFRTRPITRSLRRFTQCMFHGD